MSTVVPNLLPLINGEKLPRDEFLRRYEAMPNVKKAELIGGVVRMPAPVSLAHATRDNRLSTWLGVYAAFTPGCEAANNATWLMLEDAPQPDSSLRILPEHGGSSGIEGLYAAGAPELIGEVSQTSADIDLGDKKKLYREAGVREYIVFLVAQRELRWYRLSGNRYQLLPIPTDGILRSGVFPGLWLDVAALLKGDMPRVLEALHQGLKSPAHAAFVSRLAKRRG
jgi:Uma2 family endonuclease